MANIASYDDKSWEQVARAALAPFLRPARFFHSYCLERERTIVLFRAFLPYISLFKTRIVALLLFVSLASALYAAGGIPGPAPLFLLLLTGSLAACGASALNHYLERDLDVLMQRTRKRPLVLQQVTRPKVVLWLGIGSIALATIIALPFYPWQGFFLVTGAFVYVVVYTMWLKRRSRWNVVWGGAAGSCAVLAGWSAVGAWWSPQPLLLALLLFLWTPPHFWSLAVLHLEDYRRAGVPMLPVVAGPGSAARWGLAYTILVVLVSVGLIWAGRFGILFTIITLASGLFFIVTAVWFALHPNTAAARLHFRASIIYLAAIFASMMLDVLFRL